MVYNKCHDKRKVIPWIAKRKTKCKRKSRWICSSPEVCGLGAGSEQVINRDSAMGQKIYTMHQQFFM